MYASARRAYESATKASDSGRELEAAALYKAARLLESCIHGWDAPDRERRLDEALRYDQRLWTFFQGELAADDCLLPTPLRVNLLKLSAFIDRRVLEMTAAPTPSGLRALVDINRQVAAGLSVSTPPRAAGDRAA